MGKDGNFRRTVIAGLVSAVLSRDHPQHRRHAVEESAIGHRLMITSTSRLPANPAQRRARQTLML
jgi:hypothetical protein